MKINSLEIRNFKTIRELSIKDIDQSMIIVGKNSTGKTTILHAIRAVAGDYEIRLTDFNDRNMDISITVELEISDDDILQFHAHRLINDCSDIDLWYSEFCERLPGFTRISSTEEDEQAAYSGHEISRAGILKFTYNADTRLNIRYSDSTMRENNNIRQILPHVIFIDASRDVRKVQQEILYAETQEEFEPIRDSSCILDKAIKCNKCFRCIDGILSKCPGDLSVPETVRLLEHKVFQIKLDTFMSKLNKCYSRNSGRTGQDFRFDIDLDPQELLKFNTTVESAGGYGADSVDNLSTGAKCIYMLSLLEAYTEENRSIPSIILIEDPEIYLHPQLQKTASEVLYRLSKKNQVIFSTHSPNLIFNFNSKQIKQVVLDEDYYTTINEDADIDYILDDLGYSANDLMNVNFVFIVEGKQDCNRLPLLLNKYYSEIYGDDGNLQRISIITTNSCTNIKTYANLKYMNKVYLKDQFIMIRDSDGKKPETLVKQLCNYYFSRSQEDLGNLPRIQPRNVLVLKYYSFENYFLNPKVMVKIGVINREEEFYNILSEKFKSFLCRIPSVRRMKEITGLTIRSKEDIKRNMETIKIYVRGHNLFDIFYGKYKGEQETEILTRYIEEAPRSDFADILNAIDNFIFFVNRKKEEEEDSIEDERERMTKHKKSKRNKYKKQIRQQ